MARVYVAGKITGLADYKEVFSNAEIQLNALGHQVMNPAVLGEGFEYKAYMPICLAMLEACDTVFMLSNWQDSKGAKVEHAYAKIQGKNIVYQRSGEVTELAEVE